MKIKIIFLLVSLFFWQDIKAIEPVTMAVVGVGAMTARAFFKTTTGKVFVGYVLGRAVATPTGKYLIAKAQNAIVQKQKDAATLRLQAIQVRMAGLMSSFWNCSGERSLQIANPVSQKTSESGRAFNVFLAGLNNPAAKNFKDKAVGARVLKTPASESVKRSFPSAQAHFEQINIYQEVNVGPGNTFVASDAATVREYGKKQFWKGMFFGGVAGASAMAWYDKKREERSFAKYFSE